MSCENAQERISLLLDARLPAAEREKMAQTPVPHGLSARLSVMASHERERQLARVNVHERLRRLTSKIDLAFENLMRPVALPLAGGLLSTLLVFGLMMPSLSFSHQTGGDDFSTLPQGSIVTNPYDQGADDDARDFPIFASPDQPNSDYVNIVNLTIDESGRVADWSVVRGQITDEMKSIIVLGRFVPATTFGVRTSGTIQVRQSLPPCKYTSCSATVRG